MSAAAPLPWNRTVFLKDICSRVQRLGLRLGAGFSPFFFFVLLGQLLCKDKQQDLF